MAGIGRLWAGRVYGTNTGNLFIELEGDDAALTGALRFQDERFGPVVYAIEGKFDGSTLEFNGQPTSSGEGVVVAPINTKSTLTPDGQLRGTWTSDLGTGGTFHLFPHDLVGSNKDPSKELLPERIHTAIRTLGALRLYADELGELIGFVSRDFSQGRVIVTYHERGNEIVRYASDFLEDKSKPDELRYLKLVIQEPEAYGLNRIVTVELNANGTNEVRGQGVQEAWVIGKVETVAAVLRKHQKQLADKFRRSGVTFTLALIALALVFLPELTFWRRAVFFIAVLLIAWIFNRLHARFIPNALIYLSPRQPSVIQKALPQVLSWMIAATSALAAAAVYGLLKGEISFPTW